MTLYEINQTILSLIDEETGEILDEDQLERLNIAKEEKRENIALYIKNLRAMTKKLLSNRFITGWMNGCWITAVKVCRHLLSLP